MKYGIWLDEWFRNYIQPSSKIVRLTKIKITSTYNIIV